MKAKDITGFAPGGDRKKLIELLPLKTPLVVSIFPVYACNLKCNYCMMSISKRERHFVSSKITMDTGLFAKCVQDMTQFPTKIKTLRFVGIGEPLLHPEIVNMVRMVKRSGIAKRIEIITNGISLDPLLSKELVDAGLDRIVISIQGTSYDAYKKISGVRIDFDKVLNNIKWLYDNRDKCHMYIKAADSVLEGEEDKKLFYKLFGNICDTIAIENTVPIQKGLKLKDRETTQFGKPIENVKVCPQPLHYLQINPDGNIVPCYSFEYPYLIGNAREQNIVDIWNGTAYDFFRLSRIHQLKNKICDNCKIIKYRIFEEDILDPHIDKLKEIYA